MQGAEDVARRLRLATGAVKVREQPRDVEIRDPVDRLVLEERLQMDP
jgi:hypothetical protein